MPTTTRNKRNWIFDLAFVAVLVVAAYFRLVGSNWDEKEHLHPDERFLTGVVASLDSVNSVGEYFDTNNSSLNPNNRGAGFFVYGTLPVFIVRYSAEAVDLVNAYQVEWGWMEPPAFSATGYDQINLVGRALSALADLGVIALVYLIAARLFDKRVALLAAAFSALTVMEIQQSHFWTVDNFVNFFTLLTIFFAVRIANYGRSARETKAFSPWDFVGFGVAFGLSLACKVSAPLLIIALAFTLPAALAIRLLALPKEERAEQFSAAFWWLVLAGLLSALTFRIFQPYAFQGFGFSGWLNHIGEAWQQSAGLGMLDRLKALVIAILGLNPHWVETMASLSAQVNGDADWPPSMQWARRPIWFGLQNIVKWGLSWPLALVCGAGMLWAGWRIFKGDWRKPMVILWGWGTLYFLSQSNGFNPTMRYFLPVYPALAVFGAWGVLALWDYGAARKKSSPRWQTWARPAAVLFGGIALIGAALWAWAFVQIYQQDVSRVEATRWIYQNVPGPLTFTYQQDGQEVHQPLAVPYDNLISPETPLFAGFAPSADGELTQITFKYVLAPVQLEISSGVENPALLARLNQLAELEALQTGDLQDITFSLPADLLTDALGQYHVLLKLPAGQGQMQLESAELGYSQLPDVPPQILLTEPLALRMGESVPLDFTMAQGNIPDQFVVHLRALSAVSLAPVNMHLTLTSETGTVVADQDIRLAAGTSKGAMGTEQIVELDSPIAVQAGHGLSLQLSMESAAAINLAGSAVANESSWDDGLPRRMDGFDGFGGIYQNDLNFEMYWDEDVTKLERFQNILDHSEYIFISSNRQWGSLPRIPERFPLVIAYYRALVGCPPERTVEDCYINAQVGSVQGSLGYELVQVFENAPQLGPWVINDQGAEEAFTVYDNPKVLIFRMTADYDAAQTAAILSRVDLTRVVRLTPKQAAGGILALPEERLAQQRAGGTWSELFDTENWINSSPWVSAIVWYVALTALGIAVYPIVRWALPGLKDGGYPFARLVGLLLLSYFAWMGASLGLTFSRGWLAAFAVLLVALGGLAARAQWPALKAEWKTKRAQFLRIELLFLAFFLLMLFIRVANPDLWHPAKGGEKPMDFSYFNAVLKSTSFPPYDPWFSGGYINYYYYGFVLVGSLVKLLGIVPAVAYNLILPTLFAMVAMGAYSVAWNLWTAWKARDGKGSGLSPGFVGIAAALAVLILGNLGSIVMIFEGFARLGAEGAFAIESSLLTKLGWIVRGIGMALGGQTLPFGLGDWYWNPTRIIPAAGESSPITEFPLFTFAYADMHAHMIALPVTLLGLGWALSAVLSRAWDKLRDKAQVAASFALGAVILGSLRPINTWDLPTYLLIAAIAVGYSIWRYGPRVRSGGQARAPWLLALGGAGTLAGLSLMAYQPFGQWYRQGYSSVELWVGTHTPSSSYIIHWGIFLFFIIAWLAWETRQWMADTPLSSLRKLEKYSAAIIISLALLLSVAFLLTGMEVYIAWLVLPLLVWVGLLFFRPGQDEVKRLVLFMIGTGLFLTLMVEVIRLAGDVSRMNTVFKFYMQAWVLLALGAALGLAWTVDAIHQWQPSWRGVWQFGAVLLLACASLFMLLGVRAKMLDRMAEEVPLTLDGLAYMEYSIYFEKDQLLELREDYEAIRWMQENIQGSPVIVEAHTGEYRWGSRITINTGLPSVVGWNWHQRQQREFVQGNDVWARVYAVEAFYTTTDLTIAKDFLQKYQVSYIIVGQLEQAFYPGAGMDKFEEQDGILWREVFRVGDTAIYEVLNPALAGN